MRQRRIPEFVEKLSGNFGSGADIEQLRQADEAIAEYEQRCKELGEMVLETEQLRDEFEELFAQSCQAADEVRARRERTTDFAAAAQLVAEETSLLEEARRLKAHLDEQLAQLETLRAQHLESTARLEFLKNEQTVLQSRLETAQLTTASLSVGSARSGTNRQWKRPTVIAVSAIAAALLVAVLVSLQRSPDTALPQAGTVAGSRLKDSTPPGIQVITNSIGMKFVRISSGEFRMGTPVNEAGRFPDEHLHPVRITRPYLMGLHEVTVGQFRQFVEETGYETTAEKDDQGGLGLDSSMQQVYDKKFGWRVTGYDQTDNHPVVNTTWHDAMAFVRWLSQKEGVTYRLPTEAEWEYACRAGTTTAYQTGPSEASLAVAENVGDLTLRDARLNFKDLPHRKFISVRDGFAFSSPVGSFEPNGFGLFDMAGNVCEWCSDWFGDHYYRNSPVNDPKAPPQGTMRVFRGGSWSSVARYCRAGDRARYPPDFRANYIGFRVVRVVGPVTDSEIGLLVTTNGLGMNLVRIPAGEFLMGSPKTDENAELGEFPQHRVKITEPFDIAECEVTVGQFRQFVADSGYEMAPRVNGTEAVGYIVASRKYDRVPGKFSWSNVGYKQTNEYPVANVSWIDATAFCRWLSKKENANYRLPTEEEWEYACRAGTSSIFSFGNDPTLSPEYANMLDESVKRGFNETTSQFQNAETWDDGHTFATLVGQLKPNRFGLHDMHGNVAEWCQDVFDVNAYVGSSGASPTPQSTRIVRGGSWAFPAARCRSAYRHNLNPRERWCNLGFRVVRDAKPYSTNRKVAARPAPGTSTVKSTAASAPKKNVPATPPPAKPDPPPLFAAYPPTAPELADLKFPVAGKLQSLGSEAPWPSFLESDIDVIHSESSLRLPGRQYIKTVSRTLLAEDFTFEFEFTVSKLRGDRTLPIVFVGMGTGEIRRSGPDEPSNSAYLRIHAPELHSGIGLSNHPASSVVNLGELTTEGPHFVRIRKRGDLVVFHIDVDADGQSPDDRVGVVRDVRKFVPELHEKNTHLFIGGTGEFSRISLNTVSRPEGESPSATDSGLQRLADATAPPPAEPAPPTVIARTHSPDASPLPTLQFPPAAKMLPLNDKSRWPEFLETRDDVTFSDRGLTVPDRNSIRTVSGSLLSDDFTYEVEFTLTDRPEDRNQGIAFVGIDTFAKTTRGPQHGAFLRIHHPDLEAGVGLATHRSTDVANFGRVLVHGPHLVRVEKRGNYVSFYYDADADGSTPDDRTGAIPDLKTFLPDLYQANAYLFFGGAAEFSRVSLKTGSAPGTGEPPVTGTQQSEFVPGQWYRLDARSPWPGFLTPEWNTILQHNGLILSDSQMVRSTQRDFLERDFALEVLFAIDPASPIVQIGIGESQDTASAILFIPHESLKNAVRLLRAKTYHPHMTHGKQVPTGVHRAIIEKTGDRVQFAIDVHNDGQTTDDLQLTIPSIREYERNLHSKNTCLLLGRGLFKQVRLTTK